MFSTTTRVAQALLLLLSGMSSMSFAETITLKATAVNSVQIQAFKSGEKTVHEIQLGGGSDQPPHDTMLTGKASVVIGEKTYVGDYRLSTAPAAQLRMINATAGTRPGTSDRYRFVAGHAVLAFQFAATDSFRDPWLTGTITIVSATQQVPGPNAKRQDRDGQKNGDGQNGNGQAGDGQNGDNGNEHPPILLAGSITGPLGGSLGASHYASSDIQLMLRVGGNQRLLDLTARNTHSGMSLGSGMLTARFDPKYNSGSQLDAALDVERSLARERRTRQSPLTPSRLPSEITIIAR
jgi:hypothetical protein